MDSVHLLFLPMSDKQTGMQKIVYRISNKRTHIDITTDLTIQSNARNHNTHSMYSIPKNIRHIVQSDIDRIHTIVAEFETNFNDYSLRNIADEFQNYLEEFTVKNYMRRLICNLHDRGQTRTAETYQSALSSFMKYREGRDLHMRLITAEEIEHYETFLKQRGLILNTISFYMRILRAVYNRAVDEQIVVQTFPFKNVYTGIDTTVKRALNLSSLRLIKNLNLKNQPSLEYARDMFLLSFYLRGMSFVDMAYLKKIDLHGNTIYYRRRKTGRLLSVRWTAEMGEITNKYDSIDNPYLLPILNKSTIDKRSKYRNVSYNINRSLKKIARIIGLEMQLTLYCARHSWASVARSEGISLPIISEGMGHSSESTTRIYLASLDTSAIDKANSSIIQLLN